MRVPAGDTDDLAAVSCLLEEFRCQNVNTCYYKAQREGDYVRPGIYWKFQRLASASLRSLHLTPSCWLPDTRLLTSLLSYCRCVVPRWDEPGFMIALIKAEGRATRRWARSTPSRVGWYFVSKDAPGLCNRGSSPNSHAHTHVCRVLNILICASALVVAQFRSVCVWMTQENSIAGVKMQRFTFSIHLFFNLLYI